MTQDQKGPLSDRIAAVPRTGPPVPFFFAFSEFSLHTLASLFETHPPARRNSHQPAGVPLLPKFGEIRRDRVLVDFGVGHGDGALTRGGRGNLASGQIKRQALWPATGVALHVHHRPHV